MLRRLSKWSVVFALCFTLGLHWAVLQGIAWTTMFVGYAQAGSVSDAFEKTFSGKAPCKLCKLVAEGKQAGHQQEIVKSEAKFDFLCGSACPRVFPPELSKDAPPAIQALVARSVPPLSPPPKAA